MRSVITLFAMCLICLLGGQSTRADFLYDFHYDQLVFNGTTYAAGDFSFTSPTILQNVGDTANVSSGSLDGFTFAQVGLGTIFPPPTFVFQTGAFAVPDGSVGGLEFFVAPALGPGTHSTNDAERGIGQGGADVFVSSAGSLTITTVSTVPEPASLGYLTTIISAGLLYRRQRRIVGRPDRKHVNSHE